MQKGHPTVKLQCGEEGRRHLYFLHKELLGRRLSWDDVPMQRRWFKTAEEAHGTRRRLRLAAEDFREELPWPRSATQDGKNRNLRKPNR